MVMNDPPLAFTFRDHKAVAGPVWCKVRSALPLRTRTTPLFTIASSVPARIKGGGGAALFSERSRAKPSLPLLATLPLALLDQRPPMPSILRRFLLSMTLLPRFFFLAFLRRLPENSCYF